MYISCSVFRVARRNLALHNSPHERLLATKDENRVERWATEHALGWAEKFNFSEKLNF